MLECLHRYRQGRCDRRGKLGLCRRAGVGEGNQFLLDHVIGRQRMAEEPMREIRDRCTPLPRGRRAVGNHGGASADVDHVGRGATFLEPADQHGHVRALSPAIGMQFVEHEEPQAAAHPVEKTLILRPHKHQFAHDVVRQQDLRRLLPHLLPVGLTRVASVLGKADRERAAVARLVTLLQLGQGVELRVYQRVHRVDHEGGDAIRGVRVADQVVDDRQKIRQAFARAGA